MNINACPASLEWNSSCWLGTPNAKPLAPPRAGLGAAASFMTILRLLARQTRLPGATDNSTTRGTARVARAPPQLPHAPCSMLLKSPPPSKPPPPKPSSMPRARAWARMLRVSNGVMYGVCILSGQKQCRSTGCRVNVNTTDATTGATGVFLPVRHVSC
jgi:hypothetical protein